MKMTPGDDVSYLHRVETVCGEVGVSESGVERAAHGLSGGEG